MPYTNWDIAEIIKQINSLSKECLSLFDEDINSFELKKDLYQIKAAVDHALRITPYFGTSEDEWLIEQERKKLLKHLKS